MKTNKKLYNQNKSNLYSHLKDGTPKGLQLIIAKSYPIILILIGMLCTILFKNIKSKKSFFLYTFLGSVFGLSWSIFMTFGDPNFPGWMYHPWSIIGIDFGIVFEDILFYTLCGAFFGIIKNSIPDIKKGSSIGKSIVISLCVILGLASNFVFNTAGISITYWFLLPGILMFLYTFKEIDLYKLFFIWMFVILFACGWDILVVTTIPAIKNMSWASSWIYLTFDVNNVAHHSNLFLSYNEHKWAWIGMSPIEITPWFSICGGLFCYTLEESCKKLLRGL